MAIPKVIKIRAIMESKLPAARRREAIRRVIATKPVTKKPTPVTTKPTLTAKEKVELVKQTPPVPAPTTPTPVTYKGTIEIHRDKGYQVITGEEPTSMALAIPRKTEWTKQEWEQRAREHQQDWGKVHQQSIQAIASIDPAARYEYQGGVIKGAVLKPILEKKHEDITKGYLEAQLATGRTRDLPIGAIVKQTKTGFVIHRDIQAEQQAEWKTLDPWQQAGKAAYVGVTHWPGTLWEAFTSPITGKPVKQYQKELVTWEAGAWEQAKKVHKGEPWGFVGTTLTTPAVVEAATLGVLKGASVLARPVARATIRTALRTGTKFYTGVSRFVPEERLIGRSVFRELGKLPVVKRTYQWGTKGYRFGYRLTPGSTKPIREPFKMGLFRGEKITQKLISGKELERIWMSPTAQRTAAQKISKLMGEHISYAGAKFEKIGKGIYKLRPASIVAQETRLVTQPFSLTGKKMLVTYQTTKYLGMPYGGVTGGTMGYAFKTAAEHVKAHKLVGRPIFEGTGFTKLFDTKYLTGDLKVFHLGKVTPAKFSSLFMGKLKIKLSIQDWGLSLRGTRPSKTAGSVFGDMWKKGYVSGYVTGTGEEFAKMQSVPIFETGFGKDVLRETFAKPAQRAAEKWSLAHAMRHPLYFWKSSDIAAQQVIPKPSVEYFLKTGGDVTAVGKRAYQLGLIQRLQAPIIPAVIPSFELPILFAATKIGRELSIPWQKKIVSPTLISRREKVFALAPFSMTKLGQVSLQAMEQSPALKQMQIQRQELITAPKQETVMETIFQPTPTTVTKPYDYTYITPPAPIVAPPFIPKLGLYGRGRRFFDEQLWGEKYKFRKAAVYNPLQEMFKSTQKTTKSGRETKKLMKALWGM